VPDPGRRPGPDYVGAIPLLRKSVAADSRNADAYNLLGFSHRKLGQIDAALAHYGKALTLEPEHRGANEYLGELYLELGDL
jgi:tetratricopeptide (TPR) repeat protein